MRSIKLERAHFVPCYLYLIDNIYEDFSVMMGLIMSLYLYNIMHLRRCFRSILICLS